MIDTIKALYIKNREVISYLFWGGCTTVVSWGTYSLFVRFLSTGVELGNALSWVCATLFAYITNKIFVFRSRSWHFLFLCKEVALFVGGRLFTGIGEILAVPLLIRLGFDYSLFGVEGFPAKIIVSILVVIANYVISKLFIFRK